MTKQPHHAHQPAKAGSDDASDDAAVALIRQKLAVIYGGEPDARQEMAESLLGDVKHSKHQRFMKQLHESGRTETQIQTEWHQYYQSLDDKGKHEVWQEFYSQSAEAKRQASRLEPRHDSRPVTAEVMPFASPTPAAVSPVVAAPAGASPARPADTPVQNPLYDGLAPAMTTAGTAAPSTMPADATFATTFRDGRQPGDIRQQLRDKVRTRGKLKLSHHLQSLLFGLGFGALTLLIVLFSFFNEVVIAPFIQPSRQVSATPIIVSPDGVTASDKNEVIIPKINVQIPLDFSAKTTDEKEFEAALDKGVAHYPTTALPGQKGNASFFGHSSNNIFNPGKYKFAFVMLNELVEGDTFYVTYDGTAYAYQVYAKKIVAANAIEILNPVPDKTATAMLVTCDPPGTSLRRLAVWGEQVSPNPNANVASTAGSATTGNVTSEALPGNGPTLWGRIISFFGD